MRPIPFLLALLIFIFPRAVTGQDTARGNVESVSMVDTCPQQDVFDILTAKKMQAPEIPSRKVRAIILPLFAYAPVTGFQFGAGSTLSWTLGKHTDTKLSAGQIQLLWTTQKQLISYVRTSMFFDHNEWLLQTDWRWYLFRMPTYGLGTGPQDYSRDLPIEPGNEDGFDNDGRYPMEYNWIRLHNVLFREVVPNYYIGLGYHFDYYYDIQDLLLKLSGPDAIVTPHYAYCVKHGFNSKNYTASGLSLQLSYDSRDNIINPYKGIYVNLNYLSNIKPLGSSRNGSRLWAEFRTYIGLSRKTPRHLLAFWVFGNFQTSGTMPYLNLMAIGFDKSNSSGRGYAQGRWRGEHFVYGEAEYRFPISRCTRIIGGVLFANVSTASSIDNQAPLFGYLKPGCGFGLRIMVGKHDRTNILIDFGLGQLTHGFYLQAQEIF